MLTLGERLNLIGQQLVLQSDWLEKAVTSDIYFHRTVSISLCVYNNTIYSDELKKYLTRPTAEWDLF